MALYYYAKKRDRSFDDVLVQLITTFEHDGFAVVSRTDIQNLLSERLGVDIRRYVIFSVIHPTSAYRAILAEYAIDNVIVSNVIVREHVENYIEVAAVNPVSVSVEQTSPERREVISGLGKSIERIISSI